MLLCKTWKVNEISGRFVKSKNKGFATIFYDCPPVLFTTLPSQLTAFSLLLKPRTPAQSDLML